jgi:hypothetical protein
MEAVRYSLIAVVDIKPETHGIQGLKDVYSNSLFKIQDQYLLLLQLKF